MRHFRTLALLPALCLLLTGCVAAPATVQQPAAATLPPAAQPYTAPVGDAALEESYTADLYLPALGGDRLIARQSDVTLNRGRHPAEAVVRALLAYESDGQARSLGGEVSLQLSGVNPVETSCGVCTVTLSASALALEPKDRCTVAQAIAATLQPLGIESVSLLVAGQAPAMDITGALPLGSVSARAGEALSAAWDQLEARKPTLGEDPAAAALTAAATLYFPTAEGSGILSETRDLSFPGQTPSQLAAVLLSALSAGSRELTCAADMPDLSAWLLSAPRLVSSADSAARVLELNFVSDLPQRLTDAGLDAAGFSASVVYTLTTFIPSLTAVDCLVGGQPLTSVRTADYTTISFANGRMTRSDFAALLMDEATLYLVQGDALCAVRRPVPYYAARSPRYLLQRLMEGPTPRETAEGLTSLLPAALGDADILGMTLADDTLLLNLSVSFANMSRDLTPKQEQLMAYQIVNTLCAVTSTKRLRFFFASRPLDTIAGSLWWNGAFLKCLP